MRIYSESNEETLRARKLLKEWKDDGLLTKEQYQRLEQETPSGLRVTNVFLRLVLFLFTLLTMAAAAGLFFVLFLDHANEQALGVFLLVFAGISYAAAEFAVTQKGLYRFGIEEALAVCAVGFLCAGLHALFFGGSYGPQTAKSLVPAVGVIFSLWIWHRFGLWYALLGAMLIALFLPGYWTSSVSAQHVIVAVMYAAGLMAVAALRDEHRRDYLDEIYSLAEAFLWLGVYLALNLKVSSLDMGAQWWGGRAGMASEYSRPFYWATWVLIWCLPPVVLARGIRWKDRSVMAVGAVIAILTFVSNKPYLGWARHTWDPIILGVLLAGGAEWIRRWLASGPLGIRHGFTAARLSGKDKHWMNVGSSVLGMVTPQSVTPSPQAGTRDFQFGGGASGGGGASSEF